MAKMRPKMKKRTLMEYKVKMKLWDKLWVKTETTRARKMSWLLPQFWMRIVVMKKLRRVVKPLMRRWKNLLMKRMSTLAPTLMMEWMMSLISLLKNLTLNKKTQTKTPLRTNLVPSLL